MLVDPEVRPRASGAPRSGIRWPASSARCRSSGARSIRRSWRCSSRRRSRSASPSSSPSSVPRGCGSRSCSSPSCWPRSRRSSTACGASSCWCRAVRAFETSTAGRRCASCRSSAGPPLGVGMLSAALILAIMVIPFTSSVAREVLKSVPVAQREGAYALGATRFEAIRAALFYARTGIVGAVMLGFGRALGETMAVTMVIGNNPQVSAVAVRAAVHDGGGHRQRVHRSGRRAVSARARSRSAWCCSSSR